MRATIRSINPFNVATSLIGLVTGHPMKKWAVVNYCVRIAVYLSVLFLWQQRDLLSAIFALEQPKRTVQQTKLLENVIAIVLMSSSRFCKIYPQHTSRIAFSQEWLVLISILRLCPIALQLSAQVTTAMDQSRQHFHLRQCLSQIF